jgi:HEAT repeat protein
VIDALIQLLERLTSPYQSEDEYLCEEVINTLGIIGKNNNRAIDTLTDFLQKNLSDSLCCLTARVLWYIDPGNLIAINICTQLLKSSVDAFVIHDSALFLLKEELNDFTATEEFTNLAINKLVSYISNDQWIDSCGKSIFTLEQIVKSNKTALEGFFQLLETVKDTWVRVAVANSLLRIDAQNKQALTVIYQALNTIEDDWELYNVAKNLLDIDPKNKIGLDIFRKLISTSKEPYSRLEIAKRLLKLEPSNQTAIDTLCELIYMPRLHNCIPEQDLALPV